MQHGWTHTSDRLYTSKTILCRAVMSVHASLFSIQCFIQFLSIIFCFWKIIKIAATRWHILKLKCTKFAFGWGSVPIPGEGAYMQRFPRLPSKLEKNATQRNVSRKKSSQSNFMTRSTSETLLLILQYAEIAASSTLNRAELFALYDDTIIIIC